MRHPLPPAPTGWAPAAHYDSRGPGAYCPNDNTYVAKGGACRACGLRVPASACEEAPPQTPPRVARLNKLGGHLA